ncbi:MAG: CHAT domain-containing tetratricopeptide repeat protein [Saprospiraceae bacterium]
MSHIDRTVIKTKMMKRSILNVYLIGLMGIGLYGQSSLSHFTWADTIQANSFLTQAKLLKDSSYFEKALPLLEKSIEIWASLDTTGNLKEAEAWFQVGINYNRLHQFEEAKSAILKCLLIQRVKLSPNHKDFIPTLTYIGTIEIPQSMYEEATKYLEEALLITQLHYQEESKEIAKLTYLLGQSLLFTDKYERSLSVLEKCLAIQQKVLPPFHKDFSDTYRSLGSWYSRQLKYETALVYLIKGLENIKYNSARFNMTIPILCSEIGQIYLGKKDYVKALEYFDIEKAEMIKGGLDSTIEFRWTMADFAKLYYAEANYNKAIDLFSNCIDLFRKASKKNNGNIAILFQYLGKCQSGIGAFDPALISFSEERRILLNRFGPECPDLYLADSDIAENYRRWFVSTGKIDLLESSRLYFDMAQNSIVRNLHNENFDLKKKRLLSKIKPILEQSINVDLLSLNDKIKDTLIEKAWQKSEYMHSFLLNSSIEETNAKLFSGIPDSLLLIESTYRNRITKLQNEKYNLIERKGLALTDSIVLKTNSHIYELRNDNNRLISTFESNYPNYYTLKYNLKNISIAETQKSLTKDQSLLEYFTGDSSIFIFAINQNRSNLVEVPLNFPLKDWVSAFHNGITGYHESPKKTSALYEKTVKEYAQASKSLFDKLIVPIVSSLTKEIIIIPDGILNTIPFEALIHSAPKDLSNFKTYPFLLQDHTISYAYSATMYDQMKNKVDRKAPTKDLLAFAPFYLNDNDRLLASVSRNWINAKDLKPLPYTGEEVTHAKNSIGGQSKMYLGADATADRFRDLAGDYKILHLGTHAKANQKQGEFSCIAFAPSNDTASNNLLFNSDLYNLTVNADLVTLSACETGTGELLEGEGMISIASAFAFAGAKCIVTSLWTVNDQSTMQLMDQFYTALNQRKSKNIALAEAKRNYLKMNPGLSSHPYYWAGFVEIGNVNALK